MTRNRWIGRALGAAAIAGSLGACDFIQSTEVDPNSVPTANIDQHFTSAQVSAYFFTESNLSRIFSMWLQQMAGVGSQYAGSEKFDQPVQEDEFDAEFTNLYSRGGLLNIRQGITKAEAGGATSYAGILRVMEAFHMGLGASIWGDLPYSEAVNPDVNTPKLDPQEAVYARVQAVLDSAIVQMAANQGNGPGSADQNFGGNLARWTAVAHTLKARFYLHWEEAQRPGSPNVAKANVACGGNCLDRAIASADLGIKSDVGTWKTIHTANGNERNLIYRFIFVDRPGYIAAGKFGVDQLKNRNDPRLPVIYSPATAKAVAGQYVGSTPGETDKNDPGEGSSSLSSTGYGRPDFALPIVSCAENYFILAEAHQRKGSNGPAQAALLAGVACEQVRLGVSGIPVNGTLTGGALLDEIMFQKYYALFLNPEIYNDYKRTCRPSGLITTSDVVVADMPRRVPYGATERQTNAANIPTTDKQPLFNANDPFDC